MNPLSRGATSPRRVLTDRGGISDKSRQGYETVLKIFSEAVTNPPCGSRAVHYPKAVLHHVDLPAGDLVKLARKDVIQFFAEYMMNDYTTEEGKPKLQASSVEKYLRLFLQFLNVQFQRFEGTNKMDRSRKDEVRAFFFCLDSRSFHA